MHFILSLVGVALQLAVAWRLSGAGLLRLFPFLATHLVANAVWILISTYLPRRTPLYVLVWEIGAVITTCSLTALFLETVWRSLEHYPGLSRRAVLGALGVMAVISTILGALEPVYEPVRILLMVQRVTGMSVAAGAIALVVVLNYLDPRRRPNVVRHERIVAVMAGVTALSAWLSNHRYLGLGAFLLNTGSILFPALWLWALRAEGEQDPRPASDPTGLQDARVAKAQLKEFYED